MQSRSENIKVKRFYRETLDWPVAYGDDQIGWEEYGRDNETHIAINCWDGPEAPLAKGGTTPVFTVEDASKLPRHCAPKAFNAMTWSSSRTL